VHLGATPNYYEDRVYRWLNFNAAVQAATSDARVPDVRDYVTAHGRMFGDESSSYLYAKKLRKKLEIKKARLLRRKRVLQGKVNRKEKEDKELAQVKLELKALKQAKRLPNPGYVMTYYDSPSQYNFDKPRNCRDWTHLREMWKLPLRINPVTAERLRSYVAAFLRSGFYTNSLAQQNPEDDALHGNHRENQHPNRILVVKLTA
jgi:hypothetical protein